MDTQADSYAPRPKASQAVAAAKRAQQHDAPSVPPSSTPHAVPLGIGALVIIALMIGMASYQLSRSGPRPLALTPQPTTGAPTAAPAVFAAPPTAAPVPTSAPLPTIAPSPAATQPAQPAQIGRGPGVPPAAPTAAPAYLEVVAAQAPHSPRGDGQPGPSGGEWVAVQPISEAQGEIIRQQVPHTVR